MAAPQATVELLGRNDISCSSEFLREVLWSELKAERERVSHTCLYSLMVGSAYSNYTPHVNTHGPNPRVPRCVLTGCNCQHDLPQLLFLLTLLFLSPLPKVSICCLSIPPPPSPTLYFSLSSLSPPVLLFFPQLRCVDNSPSVLCLVPSTASKSLHSALLRPVKSSETTAVAVRHV